MSAGWAPPFFRIVERRDLRHVIGVEHEGQDIEVLTHALLPIRRAPLFAGPAVVHLGLADTRLLAARPLGRNMYD